MTKGQKRGLINAVDASDLNISFLRKIDLGVIT